MSADFGGTTWYFDQRSNTWSPQPPWNIEADPTDPNAVLVSDPAIDATTGKIDRANASDPTTQIAMGLQPGLPGYIAPYDPNTMSALQMQQWLNYEVATGRINPNDYAMADPSGSGDPVPLGDAYHSLYFDTKAYGKAIGAVQNRAREMGATAPTNPSPAVIQKAQQDMAVHQWQHNNIGNKRGFWKESTAQGQADPTQMVLDSGRAVRRKPWDSYGQPERIEPSTAGWIAGDAACSLC